MTNHSDFGGHQDGDKRSLGHTPKYRAFHEVTITKDLGTKRNQEVIDFIAKHIAEYKGKTEEKHGIPTMIFERKADAERFAKDMSLKLDIIKSHVEVKAQKFTR
jgi:hypothetical protein